MRREMTQPHSDHFHALYNAALLRLSKGDAPNTIIRDLIAGGEAPATATQVMQATLRFLRDHPDAAVEYTTARIYRSVAEAIRNQTPDTEIIHALVKGGLSSHTSAQVVRQTHFALLNHTKKQPEHTQTHRHQPRLSALSLLTGVLMVFLLGISSYHMPFQTQEHAQATQLTMVPQYRSIQVTQAPVLNAVITAHGVKVRSGPGKEYPVITELQANDALTVIAYLKEASRFKVRLPDAREGWIRDDPDVIQLLAPQEELPPLCRILNCAR